MEGGRVTFPVDKNAPPLRVKKYVGLPWCCQVGCFAETCKSGEGECPPDINKMSFSVVPLMREDRQQQYGK